MAINNPHVDLQLPAACASMSYDSRNNSRKKPCPLADFHSAFCFHIHFQIKFLLLEYSSILQCYEKNHIAALYLLPWERKTILIFPSWSVFSSIWSMNLDGVWKNVSILQNSMVRILITSHVLWIPKCSFQPHLLQISSINLQCNFPQASITFPSTLCPRKQHPPNLSIPIGKSTDWMTPITVNRKKSNGNIGSQETLDRSSKNYWGENQMPVWKVL